MGSIVQEGVNLSADCSSGQKKKLSSKTKAQNRTFHSTVYVTSLRCLVFYRKQTSKMTPAISSQEKNKCTTHNLILYTEQYMKGIDLKPTNRGYRMIPSSEACRIDHLQFRFLCSSLCLVLAREYQNSEEHMEKFQFGKQLNPPPQVQPFTISLQFT